VFSVFDLGSLPYLEQQHKRVPRAHADSAFTATNEMQLRKLWRGDLPLGQAFWEYAIAYGTIANLVATGAAILNGASLLLAPLFGRLLARPLQDWFRLGRYRIGCRC
jgi:hypothetical protein